MLRPTGPAKGTRMHFGHAQYLPIALPLFALLAGALTVLLILAQIRVLRYAYTQLGVSSGAAFFLLFASLFARRCPRRYGGPEKPDDDA
jgi:hypothetical protein